MTHTVWQGILQLIRFDKPVGTYLLMWPTFWALFIAAQGFPSLHLTLVFALGVFVMRSAGCAINDIADRKVDGLVKRTNQRPLVAGLITTKQAGMVFSGLLLIGLLLVLTLNTFTIYLSFVAVALAASYPFMKRITHLPQLVLGLAFSWGIPMAFAATNKTIPIEAWLLFTTNVLWTVAYDTMYAMVDRDDDVHIGVKSTAILFGQYDTKIIAALQAMSIGLLIVVGVLQAFDIYYYLALAFVAVLFVQQQTMIKHRERSACFQAFINNHYALLIVLVGIVLQYI